MRLWSALIGLSAFVASVQAQTALLDLAQKLPHCSVCYNLLLLRHLISLASKG